MDFGLDDEQAQLKRSARDFLQQECPTEAVRKMIVEPAGMASDLYRKMGELGWLGAIIAEEFGGRGLPILDLALLLEEGGYAALPGPFAFSSGLAADALGRAGSKAIKQRWLPAIAGGGAVATIAISDESDSLAAKAIATAATKIGSGYRINGVKMFVPYAHAADLLVASARTGVADRIEYFAIETAANGVRIRILETVDTTRRICRVELDGVEVSAAARLKDGARIHERLTALGAIAIAADSLGGTERVLEMAVEYSKVREQFGRPIGSFQALKHAAAEIVADLEPARALLWYAAHAQDALPEREAARAAAMAKARLCEVYSRAAEKAVLMHGGIGFTWEHNLHLWYKRSRFNESFFGSPAFHRERLAALSGY